jgi:hypothetical protein
MAGNMRGTFAARLAFHRQQEVETMTKLTVTATGQIPATATDIYAVLADYRDGHALILPQEFFHDMSVVSGGHGAGTVFTYWLSVGRARRDVRMRVSEPEPYRVLLEEDVNSDLTMTFSLEQGARATKVTITASWTPSPGFKGQVERIVGAARWQRALGRAVRAITSMLVSFAA